VGRAGKDNDSAAIAEPASHVHRAAVFANDAGAAQAHTVCLADGLTRRAGWTAPVVAIPPMAAMAAIVVAYGQGCATLANAEVNSISLRGRHGCERAQSDNCCEGEGLDFTEHDRSHLLCFDGAIMPNLF